MYIEAPIPTTPLTIHKGKVPKVKRVKATEVPLEYRRKKLNIKSIIVSCEPLYDAILAVYAIYIKLVERKGK